MFKWRNFILLPTKLAHLKFKACYRSQNNWDGAYLPWCSGLLLFKKLFKDVWASSLRVSGVLVLQFGPILALYWFPASEEFVVVFDIFFV